jgi:hypothetical protein
MLHLLGIDCTDAAWGIESIALFTGLEAQLK